MTADDYKYDACLSFADEQRDYVEEVARRLRNSGLQIFYDSYESVALWGKDLYVHLDQIYRKEARFCIVFISADYANKVWTNHERRSAQARALLENREYVLPVRFDDTELPGLLPTVGYIDVRRVSLAQLADLAISKIADVRRIPEDNSEARPSAVIAAAPRSAEEQRILIELKPTGWEYLLFAGVLVQGKMSLEPQARDHQIRFAPEVRRVLGDREAVEHVGAAMEGFSSIARNMTRTLEPDAQEWAFGLPGMPGSVENIVHLGERFIKSYKDMFEWAADLRGTATSSRLERLYDLAARYVDMPIKQIDEFID